MSTTKSNVIRLYDVRPELALEHLKRSTGLAFAGLPQNLAPVVPESEPEPAPPLLTEIVELA